MEWLLMGVLFVVGLAVLAGIAMVESKGAKGLLAIVLIALIVIEKAIFEMALPTGRAEILRQQNKCAVNYYAAGCPGHGKEPWRENP
jgi:uncharacterized protein involved in response to NO